MPLTFASLDTVPAAASVAASNAASPADGASAGPGFSDRLAQAFQALPQGQDLAAASGPLKATALGPGLELLTPAQGQPDGASLAAFARAQGLDPEVVAWLFQDGRDSDPAEAPAAAAGGAPADPAQALLAGLGASLPVAPAAPAPTATPGGGAAADDLLTAGGLSLAWLSQAATGAAAGGADQPSGDGAPGFDAAVLAAAQAQAPALARQALAAGTPAQPEAAAAQADIPAEILSLEVEPEMLALLEEAADPAGGEAPPLHAGAAPAAAGATAGEAASAADDAAPAPGERAQAFQDLAQKLGQAVAQRVAAQFARGNWQMKLMLRPASLGEIEVDLMMRAGEVDAAFRSANALTRELLAEGLPRLREGLAQAGMGIADLNVATGQSQRDGGNPTPRQAAAAAVSDAVAPTGTAPAAAVRAVRRADAWDVTV